MLDEPSLRKPGFRPDVPVRLADGQTWHLPKPTVLVCRQSQPDGSRKLVTRLRLGPGYQEVLDAYWQAIEAGTGGTMAMFDLAEALVTENYALAPDEVNALLVFEPHDPASMGTWKAIVATAEGQSPASTGDPEAA